MIRDIDWTNVKENFVNATPFNHVAIDNFFTPEVADKLSEEFPDFNDPIINEHNSPLEIKKTLNHWDRFPSCTYRAFTLFDKERFLDHMNYLIDNEYGNLGGLEFDFGLNGGGWHMHGRGGNNNIHLDYNVHPKLNKQRKLNIIIYMTKDWDSSWGGGLELWSHNYKTNNTPKERVTTIENKFNRSIIFDTTQNSWHGLPNAINCPEGVIRKSLAAYFVKAAPAQTENRGRALFAPREEQKNDEEIQELIRKRADVKSSSTVYKI